MKCFNCKNKSICKFVDNTEEIEKQTALIEILINSPVKIRIDCEKYIKQDLFNNGVYSSSISETTATYKTNGIDR